MALLCSGLHRWPVKPEAGVRFPVESPSNGVLAMITILELMKVLFEVERLKNKLREEENENLDILTNIRDMLMNVILDINGE